MKTSVKFYSVDENHHGQRVDNFLLTHLKDLPRTCVYRILRKGEVRVNKKRIDPTYRLQSGDVIRIPPLILGDEVPKPELGPALAEFLKARILYEDDEVMVINKSSGMAVHGGSGVKVGVIDYLRVLFPNQRFLELAHRLDRDTSGCLIIAKSRQTLLALHEQFRSRKVRKIYQMLVVGSWPKQINRVEAPLQRTTLKSGECRVQVQSKGQPALTTFNVLSRFEKLTLLEAFPHTGRTHQLRVHALATGFPIVNDDKYGQEKANEFFSKFLGSKRLFLHACSVEFTLPSSKKLIEIKAQPDDHWPLALAAAQKSN